MTSYPTIPNLAMAMHQWHEGERAIHEKLKLSSIHGKYAQAIMPSMPDQHQVFFSSLPYFITSTLDEHGRPWASILTGQPGFIRAISPTHLAFCTSISESDPIYENLKNGGKIAALGIQFSNRRRNKVYGEIAPSMVRFNPDRELQAIITTSESLGNCPKYVSTRNLNYTHRQPGLITHGQARLDESACEIIRKSDTLFLATKGTDDLDVNHRGGPPGFLRIERSEDGDTLFLPDYSGNRFFQSLGNIELTHLAGITITDFESGDILYITGEAHNILDARESNTLMPGTQRLTILGITSWTMHRGSLNLKQVSESRKSPYTPKLYLLQSEPHRGIPTDSTQATLISKVRVTDDIAIFTFDANLSWKNGQHLIVSFRDEFEGYEHMNDSRPWSLNDDFIRSWSIVSSPPTLQIMVRRTGLVSSHLHRLPLNSSVSVLGVAGSFGDAIEGKSKVLYIIGGIGVTPFMPLMRKDLDIAVLMACKRADSELFHLLLKGSKAKYIQLFTDRRMTRADLDAVPGLDDRTILFCGPDSLYNSIRSWTTKEIFTEKFNY